MSENRFDSRGDRGGDRGDRGGDRGDRGDSRGFDRNDRGEGRGEGRGDRSEMKRGVRSKYRFEFPGDFHFDYKDSSTLYRFISEGGKITPARISKLSLAQQRRVAAAVKKARSLGLLPIGSFAYDHFDRPEAISPKPFTI